MKKHTRHVYALILSLFCLGSILFCYRHFVLDVPLTDAETVSTWVVEANLHFVADKNLPVKASFSIPYLPPHFAILDEYFVSKGYGVVTNLNAGNRSTIWSIRRAQGRQSLFYRAIVRETDTMESPLKKPSPIESEDLDESQRFALESIISQVRQSSADIQTFAQATINELNKKEGSAKRLMGNEFSEEALLKAALLVLNHSKISARWIRGLYLSTHAKPELSSLLAVFNGTDWIYINPRTGGAGLPQNFLIWHYGSGPLFELSGGKKAQFALTLSQAPLNALSVAKARGFLTDSQMLRFSLLQLPVAAQETYKILLMVPVGAFIILLLRNFIGLKTFGTFMPVLIALAFRETHVVWGVCLFVFIVSFGLLARFYLDQLRLLLVPRLAAILTVVIVLMLFISILGQSLGLDAGLSVALFPMVILTMTIERMCITWDERGPSEAIKSGLGSLFSAILCYWAMSYEPLQYLLFAFPELLLLLLALILLFGQYRGYRLLELKRFKVLSKGPL